MITSYFLNKDTQQLNQIKELSDFLKNAPPTNGLCPFTPQQLLNYRKQLTLFLSYDYNWLCVEYENTNKAIEENNAVIAADPEQKNDALYSKSYDLYYFQKNYLLAPHLLLKIASYGNQVNFGQDVIDNFKSRNKNILELTKPKFEKSLDGVLLSFSRHKNYN